MGLPFAPPLEPMLGLLADELPVGDGWIYEPKWDGFRVLVFRDGDALDLLSRDGRPLLRYFPEVGEALRAALPPAAVVDGEVVVARGAALDFEALQLRLHPAASRVRTLSVELPASFVAWDLLATDGVDLRDVPFAERRAALLELLRPSPTVRATPATTDPAVARDWFSRFEGAGLDGVMAKRASDPYRPGKRAMVKVKHARTIDAAVAGFRWHKGAPGAEVGSLVLGLFDAAGALHPIGVASSFSKKERARLAAVLGAAPTPADHPWAAWGEREHRPDLHSRWNADKDLAWVPVALGPVVEVSTTQHSGHRLRHPAKVVRWRDDKRPADCTLEQLRVVPAGELAELFPPAPGPGLPPPPQGGIG
jgi:ATP-dependent DNA ligase